MDILSGIGSVLSGVGSVLGSVFGFVSKNKETESKERLAVLGVDDNAKVLEYALAQEQTLKVNSIAKVALAGALILALLIKKR